MSHKSWYQFDLIVLAALVSPLGHLLTGGDHVKNLLFIVLLIYYLHQVIEVPWNLYISALPRKSVHSDQADADTNALAVNSLRRLEFVFLGMSLLSPLAGGALLHFVAPHITGAEPSSFFSTGLFMLATAIRPWRHLVKRLSSRTTELHDAIHYPPSSHSSSPKGKEREETQAAEIAEINVHLARFEKAIGKLRQRVGDEFDELYDNIENLERFASRQEKKTDRLDTKLKQVESAIANVQPRHFIESAVPKPLLSYILSFFPNYAPLGPMELTSTATSSTTANNGNNNHKRRPRTTSSSGLATIPEEEASSSAPTYDGLPASSSANPPPNPYRRRTTTNPQPMGIGGRLFMVVTYPVGATWRLLSGAHA
ncbi:hypothetical protein DL96DRAFT_1472548 [Flagelloscypha sp. PMI_526]|nr:hypothetical protein DL96DRAFT_1472548 [Flagelloscypha sp. PMI_526]